MRGTWVFDERSGEMVEKGEYLSRQPIPKASRLACPMIIRDCIETKSMADGQMYTSKSALRKSYREKGYVEIGNEELKAAPRPRSDKKAIKQSIMKAKAMAGLL